MFYLGEGNIYNGLFPFIYRLEYFFICYNMSFEMLGSNPVYYKRKPYVGTSFDIFSFVTL